MLVVVFVHEMFVNLKVAKNWVEHFGKRWFGLTISQNQTIYNFTFAVFANDPDFCYIGKFTYDTV